MARKPPDGGKPPAAGGSGTDDAALWERAMRDTRPLKGRRPRTGAIDGPPPAADETKSFHKRNEKPGPTPRGGPAGPPTPALPPTPELRVDSAAGLDKRLAERLRRGQVPIDGRLDLHGLTHDAARAALTARVRAAHAAGQRCLLVITGKGLRSEGAVGVLREALPLWLNGPDLRPLVLAVRQAQPRDGGAGAFYLLLRRRRDSRAPSTG